MKYECGGEKVKQILRKLFVGLLVIIGIVAIWQFRENGQKNAGRNLANRISFAGLKLPQIINMNPELNSEPEKPGDITNLVVEVLEDEEDYHAVVVSGMLVIVDDKAHILSRDSERKILDVAQQTADQTNETIIVVTEDDMNGKNSREYADGYYDNAVCDGKYNVCEDGYLVLINMEERIIYISTCGEVIDEYTDRELQANIAILSLYLANKNYEAGIIRLLHNTP
ncbi:MAG: TPM domain-containing protein [Roseburia sp.]